jgi:hypothetical protein
MQRKEMLVLKEFQKIISRNVSRHERNVKMHEYVKMQHSEGDYTH